MSKKDEIDLNQFRVTSIDLGPGPGQPGKPEAAQTKTRRGRKGPQKSRMTPTEPFSTTIRLTPNDVAIIQEMKAELRKQMPARRSPVSTSELISGLLMYCRNRSKKMLAKAMLEAYLFAKDEHQKEE